MSKNLDSQRIENERSLNEGEIVNKREFEKKRIQDTIAKNRSGERIGRVIQPVRKLYAVEEQKRIRVAAYCRVSTQEENQAGSFEMQIQHFKSVIENTPNYEPVKIYVDEGISGTSVNKRKGFQEMIEDACAGKIDLILTKSISRFGRNIVDILTTLRKLSDLTPPVAVIFESEGINTSDAGNKLIISILSALAELESQQKSIAIKEGIRYRMQEGLYRFSVANTIGYYRDYAGEIQVASAEAEIVRHIFNSFTERRLSPKEIAQELTEQGIRSPRKLDHWNESTIKNILKNEKYVGDVLYQKTFSKDYISHKTVRNNGILNSWYWQNNHQAIIERDQFDKAQNFLKHTIWRKKKNFITEYTAVRIDTGPLKNYFLLDALWSPSERRQFLQVIQDVMNSKMD